MYLTTCIAKEVIISRSFGRQPRKTPLNLAMMRGRTRNYDIGGIELRNQRKRILE